MDCIVYTKGGSGKIIWREEVEGGYSRRALWAVWLNVAYAISFNVPLIVVQRFNRPRLERLLHTSR